VRLEKELMAIRPFRSAFRVNLAADPAMDAWRGASSFGQTAPSSVFITRADYQECGADYFVEHGASNKRFKLMTPPPQI